MPGTLNVANAFANTLRISIRFSRYIDQIAEAIRDDAVFERSHLTQRDPTYITRNKDGKVKRYWCTKEDEAQRKKLAQYSRILMEGVKFLQPEWYKQRVGGMVDQQTKYQAYNFLKLISQAQTDLIAGGGVKIKTGIDEIDTLLNDDMQIGESIYEWLFEASALSYIGVQVIVDKDSGTLELQRVLPQFLWVSFPKNKDNDWTCISKKIPIPKKDIRDWQKIKGIPHESHGSGGFDKFIFEERHFKGYYENYLWAVKGREIVAEVPLEYYKPDLKRVVVTGLQDFAIVILPNKITLGTFQSEWDGVIDHNLSFNDRASREGELLNKYAGPQMMVSETAVTFDPSTGKTFYRVPREGVILVRPQDKFTPDYLQPQADIAGSESNREFILDMIATESQTAPVLLSSKKADAVETGVAYKLKLTPTLNKVNRRRGNIKSSLQRLIFVIISAIDYYSDFKVAESVMERAQMEGAAEEIKEKARLIQKFIESNAVRISLKSFNEVFQKVEVLKDAPLGLFIEDPTKAGNTEELDYLVTQNQLQEIENRHVAVQAVIRENDIDIQMMPALPQDVSQSIDRLGGKSSLSLYTFLTEVDGRSEEEAIAEIKRIQEEGELFQDATPFGLGGVALPGDETPPQDVATGDMSDQVAEMSTRNNELASF